MGNTLLELRRTVEDLDPSQATGVRKFLGVIPFGDKVVDYFRRYESAQSQLNGILHSLRNGQDELTRDNVALNMEKQNLWAAMGRLNQYIYIAERLDTQLVGKISELELSDPERAKALSQDVLFYVRQKHQDLLTQLAVSIQSYLAIDIIIKNNIELIKGVDRASTTTVSALRTAVIVAQALGNQKLVLDQITALNTTTSDLIQRTSEMLKDNSAQIQQQAASATIGLPQLQAAFANIYATMDSIDTFKLQALDTMAATIGTLEGEVVKSREYLERVNRQDQQQATGALDLTDSGHAARTALSLTCMIRILASMGFREWVARITGRAPAPPPRHRAPRSPAAPTENDILAALDRVQTMITGGVVPAAVESRVKRVSQTVRDTMPRLRNLGLGSPEAYSVMATATDYLPEAIGSYTRLPAPLGRLAADRERQDLADAADRPARPARLDHGQDLRCGGPGRRRRADRPRSVPAGEVRSRLHRRRPGHLRSAGRPAAAQFPGPAVNQRRHPARRAGPDHCAPGGAPGDQHAPGGPQPARPEPAGSADAGPIPGNRHARRPCSARGSRRPFDKLEGTRPEPVEGQYSGPSTGSGTIAAADPSTELRQPRPPNRRPRRWRSCSPNWTR